MRFPAFSADTSSDWTAQYHGHRGRKRCRAEAGPDIPQFDGHFRDAALDRHRPNLDRDDRVPRISETHVRVGYADRYRVDHRTRGASHADGLGGGLGDTAHLGGRPGHVDGRRIDVTRVTSNPGAGSSSMSGTTGTVREAVASKVNDSVGGDTCSTLTPVGTTTSPGNRWNSRRPGRAPLRSITATRSVPRNCASAPLVPRSRTSTRLAGSPSSSI